MKISPHFGDIKNASSESELSQIKRNIDDCFLHIEERNLAKIPKHRNQEVLLRKVELKRIELATAKVQPDITEIENKLGESPFVSSHELRNSDYQAEMISLVNDDGRRQTRKQA